MKSCERTMQMCANKGDSFFTTSQHSNSLRSSVTNPSSDRENETEDDGDNNSSGEVVAEDKTGSDSDASAYNARIRRWLFS